MLESAKEAHTIHFATCFSQVLERGTSEIGAAWVFQPVTRTSFAQLYGLVLSVVCVCVCV